MRVLFDGADLIGPRTDFILKARKRIAAETAIPERSVIIASTHTHAGPCIAKGPVDKPVDVDQYRRRAETVSSFCTLLWSQINDHAGPNMFHNFRKRIDPGQYGRAECFRTECSRLAGELRVLLELYDEEQNKLTARWIK